MNYYRPAGQEFIFPAAIPELAPFMVSKGRQVKNDRWPVPASAAVSCRTTGLVGCEQREIECWSAPPGIILKVSGGSDFYIAPGGLAIVRAHKSVAGAGQNDQEPNPRFSNLDREILLGPALGLALAQRGTWCLHASAVKYKDQVIVFLGESGRGKSTLARSLADAGTSDWWLVADDILPVTLGAAGVNAWPRFPQLKLPLGDQPGPGLPEKLPLTRICLLTPTEADPELQMLPLNQAVQALLSHTAGTRLFSPELLAKHLEFCTQAAGQLPVYRLAHPHRREALPLARGLLEAIC